MDIIAMLVLYTVISKLLINNIIKMLIKTKGSTYRKINYRGKAIPAIGGIVFVPVLLNAILLILFLRIDNLFIYLRYLVIVLCMGFIGVIDDLVGDNKTKGFKNHCRSTLKGRMTTGFLKALMGFLGACIINLGTTKTLSEYIVNVLVISLFANTLNLFDLRPGRAIKVFLLVAIIILYGALYSVEQVLPLIMLGIAVILYFPCDLKEICMLGDTGANLLGISLGYYSTLIFSFETKLGLLILLILINIISERKSISEIIKDSRLLSYLDNLGREQVEER